MLTSLVLQLQNNAEAYARAFLGLAHAGNLRDAVAGEMEAPSGDEGSQDTPAGSEGGQDTPPGGDNENVNAEG